MRRLVAKEGIKLKSVQLRCWVLIMLIPMLIAALPIVSQCKVAADSTFSYVADFEQKSKSDASSEIIGSINMLGNESIGLYLNNREISGYDTCTYHSDGDYIDTNGNELYFKAGSPVVSDATVGFRVNMGEEILTTGTKYSSLSVLQGVIKDIDDDSISDSFGIRDSVNARQEILRNYHESNLVRIYSYINDVSSYKEITVSNKSWNDIRIEVNFSEAESDVLYTLNTYCNNILCGTIEIPKKINTTNTYSVVGSTGKTVSVTGEFEFSGPYLFNFLTSNGTLIKDVYIHSGLGKTQNVLVPVNTKTDFLDDIIVNEQFADKTVDNNLIMQNFGIATNNISSGYITLSYAGDGIKTAKDMTDSPVIKLGNNSKSDKYIFRARYKFNDFKIERCLAQFISEKDGTQALHAPILKTAIGSTMRKSTLVISYLGGDDGTTQVIKSADIANDIWYDVEIVADVSGTFPAYQIKVTSESGAIIFDEYIKSDKTAELLSGSVFMQIKMNNTLEEINALSGTTKMYLDDIYFSSIHFVEGIQVNDVKIFDGDTVVDTALPHNYGENLLISALISNYGQLASSGCMLVCQYKSSDELLSANGSNFNISAAFDPYTIDSFPTSDAVSIKFKLDKDTSYIKIFILDSLNKLTPYTKTLNLNV